MSWISEHKRSEQRAAKAYIAAHKGNEELARKLYSEAAEYEEQALAGTDLHKPRTYGITAVSAVALYRKAGRTEDVQRLAGQCLSSGRLPGFAYRMIREMQEE